MARFSRALLGLALAFGLTGTAAALSLPKLGKPAAHAAAPLSRLKPGEWPQATSDLPADPAVRFGSLPNGMRYAIMKNATPTGQASLRLRFAAGSMMETDAQQGLAHFLEHMAFNGSKNVPSRGEMVKILERLGLGFGADTNASTNWEDTQYQLNLPKSDDESIDTSLMLLREVAGNLLLNQKDIDSERGVILSEERARDTPSYRIYKARFGFLLDGQAPPLRYPIGKVEVIQNAQRAQIADFYAKYYRPERATLVAVGDFDVAAMEAKIRARFSDWKGVGRAGADPDEGQIETRSLQTSVAVETGSATMLQLSWMTPPDLAPDSVAKETRGLIERLGLAVLNRRLATLAREDNPPFISAGAFRGNELHAARETYLIINALPDGWKTALTVAEQEQRRAVQFGVRPEELQREITEQREEFKLAVSQAATRRTPALADEIAGTTDDDSVQTSPETDLALFEKIVKDLTPEQVSAALKAVFQGQGPLLFMSSPTPIEGGGDVVQAAYVASRDKPVSAPTAQVQLTWPYTDFGAPGQVAERRDIVDLDTVMVRFANGVRLTIKPTKFRDDQIMVKVRIGAGLESMPADHQNMNWAGPAFIEGGLKRISADDTERVLASAVVGAQYQVEDDAFSLAGATRRDDMVTELQLLAAHVADPGWRTEAFQRQKTFTATLLDQWEATDSGVLGRDLGGLMHAGDRRWTFPSRSDIDGATLDVLRSQIDPVLQNGPIEVVIVGDTTVDKAIDAVARTFGALPPRPAAAPPPAPAVGFPAPTSEPVTLTHKGRADQAIAYQTWRTNDFFADTQRARTVSVLGEAMELRLIDVLRQKEGVTYSPQADSRASFTWPGWGYISAIVEAPPGKLDAIFADIDTIAADLRDKDITADELERAKKPLIEQIEKSRQTNEWWLSFLSGAQADPRILDAIRSQQAALERVTAADVRATAQRYLLPDRAWRLIVKPRDGAQTAAASAAPVGAAPARP